MSAGESVQPVGGTGYDRYCGFILGFALGLLAQPFMKVRYAKHRTRLRELATDLHMQIRLPLSHSIYRKRYGAIVDMVSTQLGSHPQALVDFFDVGSVLLLRLVSNASGVSVKPAYREHFSSILEQYGVDAKSVEWLLRRHARRAASTDQEYELLSTAYEVLAFVLDEVPPDERTVFVVMPFSAPYPARYESIHRPALLRAGFRPVRAWEGVGGERYLDAVQALMSVCRGVVAVLGRSPGARHANLNVVHEIGIAQGMGHRVVVLRPSARLELPSNLDVSLMLPFNETPRSGDTAQLRFLAKIIKHTFTLAHMPKKLPGRRFQLVK